jgi:peptide/nickel transport system substrate-binding protein
MTNTRGRTVTRLAVVRRRRRTGRAVVAAAASTAVLVALAACGGTSTGSSTGSGASSTGGIAKPGTSTGGTLTLGLTQGSFTSYNPWAAGAGINGALWNVGALYDSLTKLNADGTVAPSLATSWTVAGKVVTLKLRSGITFDDGTPLDAAAVKANFDYASAHPAGAECNSYITGVKTTVMSPTEVRLNLASPVAGILQDFAQCAGWMVDPKALANDQTLTGTPDGTGPYTLDKADTVVGTTYTYTRRAKYWDLKDYPYAKIVITVFTSATAADNAAKSGQIDYIQQVAYNDTASGFKILATHPDEFRGFYITDVTGAVSKPLGNLKVRQAMEYAIDRNAIEKGLFGNYAETSSSTPFGSNQVGYQPSLASYYTFNQTKAKNMLAAAGYPNGFSVNALVDPGDQKLAEAIAGYLRQVGINLTLSVHNADYITQMLTGSWPLVLGNYTLNPAQLQTLEGIAGPNGFWNPRHNTNPTFTSLFTQITNAPTMTAQKPLLESLATAIASQAWYLNPVIVATTSAYNDKAVSVKVVSGVPVPFLYQFTPVS